MTFVIYIRLKHLPVDHTKWSIYASNQDCDIIRSKHVTLSFAWSLAWKLTWVVLQQVQNNNL